MISIGIGVAMSGLVIAQLKDETKKQYNSNDVKLSLDQESWFGNHFKTLNTIHNYQIG